MTETAITTPPHTRLILAAEDLLEMFGTRTESGQRITAGWGEQQPEGWYEVIFRTTDDEGTQDMRDGAALRRLREAVRFGITPDIDISIGPEVGVNIMVDYGMIGDRHFGRGSTIAEAADKCREAL